MRKLFRSLFGDEAQRPAQRFEKLRELLDGMAVEDFVPGAWEPLDR